MRSARFGFREEEKEMKYRNESVRPTVLSAIRKASSEQKPRLRYSRIIGALEFLLEDDEEMVHAIVLAFRGPQPIEHRGSRALDKDLVREAPAEPIDRMFQEAADAGFKPLTPEQAAAFREKLRGVSAVLHGGRR